MFPSDAGHLRTYTLVNMNAYTESQIAHVYFYGDIKVKKVNLMVRGPSWLTFSKITLLPECKGDWRVEVQDKDSKVIKIVTFRVE